MNMNKASLEEWTQSCRKLSPNLVHPDVRKVEHLEEGSNTHANECGQAEDSHQLHYVFIHLGGRSVLTPTKKDIEY